MRWVLTSSSRGKIKTLGSEQYVGVIVKCGDIKQDFPELKRQIEECAVERYFEGAKKKIYLGEIWIAANGTISHGAERKIYEEYKQKNIKFIDIDKLGQLVEKFAPHFWSNIPPGLGAYLSSCISELSESEARYSLITSLGPADFIEQHLQLLAPLASGKRGRPRGKDRTALHNVLRGQKTFIIKAPMGAGKSSLMRRTARRMCEPEAYAQDRLVPYFCDFKQLVGKSDQELQELLDSIRALASDSNPEAIVYFVDAVDEVDLAGSERLDAVCRIVSFFQNAPGVKLVLGSRPVWDIEEEIELEKRSPIYSIVPLSANQIFDFLKRVCRSLDLQERMQQELVQSALFRVLPKTPMSATLLAKVLSADVRELPQTLPELYSKYTELALGRWDASKGLTTEKDYLVISTLVSRLSKYMLDNEIDEIAQSEVLEQFREYVRNRPGVPKVEDLLQKITNRSEIFALDAAKATIRFRHRTFAEYFYALDEKERMGRGAAFKNPFDGYWLGVEYFYLGLIRDAGERIDQLSRLHLSTEREQVLKLLNMGNLLLAPHQTEYSHIEEATFRTFLDAASYFVQIKTGKLTSALAGLPEIQLLSIFSYALRGAFEFNYFRPALNTAAVRMALEADLDPEERAVLSFLIDAVRAGLREKDAFAYLLDDMKGSAPWAVRLAITHAAEQTELKSARLKRHELRLAKIRRENRELNKFIRTLYEESLSTGLKRIIES